MSNEHVLAILNVSRTGQSLQDMILGFNILDTWDVFKKSKGKNCQISHFFFQCSNRTSSNVSKPPQPRSISISLYTFPEPVEPYMTIHLYEILWLWGFNME